LTATEVDSPPGERQMAPGIGVGQRLECALRWRERHVAQAPTQGIAGVSPHLRK